MSEIDNIIPPPMKTLQPRCVVCGWPLPVCGHPQPDTVEWWREVAQGLASEVAILKAGGAPAEETGQAQKEVRMWGDSGAMNYPPDYLCQKCGVVRPCWTHDTKGEQ